MSEIAEETELNVELEPVDDAIRKHDSLVIALCHAMMEYEPLQQNHVVDYLTKRGDRVKYAYADLAHMRKVTDPALLNHGLVITDRLVHEDDRDYLETTMQHVHSEETVSTRMDVTEKSGDMQQFGGNTTYARRYNFGFLTGRVAEEDEDARPAQREPTQSPGSPPADQETPSKGNTHQQLSGRAHGLAGKLKMGAELSEGTDSEKAHNALHDEVVTRFRVTSCEDLSVEQWTEQIAILSERLTARAAKDEDSESPAADNTLTGEVATVANARKRSEAEISNYLSAVYMHDYASMHGDLVDGVCRMLKSVQSDAGVGTRFDDNMKAFAAWSIAIPGGIDGQGGFNDFMTWLTSVPRDQKPALLAKLGANINQKSGTWVRSIPPERFPEWMEVAKSWKDANDIPF